MAKILVIDDEPRVRFLLKRLLESKGHSVAEAEDGNQAMWDVYGDSDLVITDIVMPEADGLEVLMAFKKRKPDLPVIAISGGGRVSGKIYTDTAKVMGADAVFVKPFDNDELVNTVDALLMPSAPEAA